jgi:hypothetical protein
MPGRSWTPPRFVAVDSDAYDDVRLMLRRVREAGLVGAEWAARWAAVTAKAPGAANADKRGAAVTTVEAAGDP